MYHNFRYFSCKNMRWPLLSKWWLGSHFIGFEFLRFPWHLFCCQISQKLMQYLEKYQNISQAFTPNKINYLLLPPPQMVLWLVSWTLNNLVSKNKKSGKRTQNMLPNHLSVRSFLARYCPRYALLKWQHPFAPQRLRSPLDFAGIFLQSTSAHEQCGH